MRGHSPADLGGVLLNYFLREICNCKKESIKTTSHPFEWLLSKIIIILTHVGKDVEKLELFCTAGRNAK